MSTSQDSKALFKQNLTCIFLSVRAKLKKTQSITGDPVRASFYQTYYETFHFEKKESK